MKGSTSSDIIKEKRAIQGSYYIISRTRVGRERVVLAILLLGRNGRYK